MNHGHSFSVTTGLSDPSCHNIAVTKVYGGLIGQNPVVTTVSGGHRGHRLVVTTVAGSESRIHSRSRRGAFFIGGSLLGSSPSLGNYF